MEKQYSFQIIPFKKRFAIADKQGAILDSAQGYGFTTWQAAFKAALFKYQEPPKWRKDFEKWIKENEVHQTALIDFWDNYESFAKEMERGELNEEWLWSQIEKDRNVVIPDFVKKKWRKMKI